MKSETSTTCLPAPRRSEDESRTGETTRNVVEDAINRSKDYGASWDNSVREEYDAREELVEEAAPVVRRSKK